MHEVDDLLNNRVNPAELSSCAIVAGEVFCRAFCRPLP